MSGKYEAAYKVGDSLLKASEIPEVVKESEAQQNWRMALTMGIFTLVSIMFIVALSNNDMKKLHEAELYPDDLNVSYRDKDAGKEKNARSHVIGSLIQIYSPEDDLDIQYILPIYSSFDEIDLKKKINGYYGRIGDSYNNLEPIMNITQGKGRGSLFEINLINDQPISRIAIYGPADPKGYKTLTTAKVIIRDEEGKRVWQSCQFLKPEPLNIVSVISS